MYKTLYLLYIAIIVCIISISCKRETLDTYNTSNSIYFENFHRFGSYVDTTNVTFAFGRIGSTDSLVPVIVRVTGSPENTSRTFKISVDPSSTAIAGTHYTKLPDEWVFPAGQVKDTIRVKILRTADLKNGPVNLILKLDSYGGFTTKLKDYGKNNDGDTMSYQKFRITFSDILVQPQGWYYLFGKFTQKKMELICQLANISPFYLNDGDDGDIWTLNFAVVQAQCLELLNTYLTAQAAAGTPVLYEDGTPMRTDD